MILLKSKIILSIICLLLCISPVSISGLTTGSIQTFEPHPGYEFTAQATGELTWPDDTFQQISVNITAIQSPNNISRIYIDVVSFELVGQIGGVDTSIDGNTVVPDGVLTINNNTILINSSLRAPDEVNRFYVKIGVYARSDGNTTTVPYEFRFPDSNTIIVERDDFVPLIDLYGFPPDAFFQRFLPVYLAIFVIMTTPGLYFLAFRTSQRLRANSKEEIKE